MTGELASCQRPGDAVLLITAGHNDVGRGKEAGDLFAGPDDWHARLPLLRAGRARGSSCSRQIVPTSCELSLVLADQSPSCRSTPTRSQAAWLPSRELLGARDVTFGLGGTGTAGIARAALSGSAVLRAGERSVVKPIAWRPPLIAMPVFQGVADSTALTPAVRDALLAGANGGGNRSLIGLVLALVVVSLWLLVPRIGWVEPPARPAVHREPATTTKSMPATLAPDPVPARKPEDITHQTARRTAMHR